MAAARIYLFNYVPHLEKLGKAPQRCPQRPLIFWLTKETVTLNPEKTLTCVYDQVYDTSSEGAIFDSVFY